MFTRVRLSSNSVLLIFFVKPKVPNKNKTNINVYSLTHGYEDFTWTGVGLDLFVPYRLA